MTNERKAPKDIDEYISGFPQEVQGILESLRSAIRQAAPEAAETISYQIPTFKMKGNLVHFAAYKNHIGFYPGASGIEAFQKELAGYPSAKGSVQFPLNEPLPLDLIAKIVAFRVREDQARAQSKRKRK